MKKAIYCILLILLISCRLKQKEESFSLPQFPKETGILIENNTEDDFVDERSKIINQWLSQNTFLIEKQLRDFSIPLAVKYPFIKNNPLFWNWDPKDKTPDVYNHELVSIFKNKKADCFEGYTWNTYDNSNQPAITKIKPELFGGLKDTITGGSYAYHCQQRNALDKIDTLFFSNLGGDIGYAYYKEQIAKTPAQDKIIPLMQKKLSLLWKSQIIEKLFSFYYKHQPKWKVKEQKSTLELFYKTINTWKEQHLKHLQYDYDSSVSLGGFCDAINPPKESKDLYENVLYKDKNITIAITKARNCYNFVLEQSVETTSYSFYYTPFKQLEYFSIKSRLVSIESF